MNLGKIVSSALVAILLAASLSPTANAASGGPTDSTSAHNCWKSYVQQFGGKDQKSTWATYFTLTCGLGG